MTASRLFIAVLILVALLFVVGIGIGLRQNDAQPDPHNFSPPDWSNSLSDWLSPSLDLKTVQTVAGTCLQVGTKTFDLAAGSNCKLQVPSARQKYRKAKLHLLTGAAVKVVYTSPPNEDPNLSKQELSWPGKDPQSLLVLEGGGNLNLSCGAGAACQLQME
jgi:hypothetical protein